MDPAAVREVSALGVVVARTTQELSYENTTMVIETMISDVGRSDFAEALDVVRDRLRERGWVVTDAGLNHLDMRSAESADVRLDAGFPSLLASFPAEQHAEIAKAMKATVTGAHAYVMVTLTRAG
uniref:Uncharacterized protein n=1 Tax=Nonomuraea gerenzanensis TaxID=93944 RepID=A0A1M4E317_9ACTN|nr:hypothetical protein BN4615_P2727 [Nonomuraea gerenzanensis]